MIMGTKRPAASKSASRRVARVCSPDPEPVPANPPDPAKASDSGEPVQERPSSSATAFPARMDSRLLTPVSAALEDVLSRRGWNTGPTTPISDSDQAPAECLCVCVCL